MKRNLRLLSIFFLFVCSQAQGQVTASFAYTGTIQTWTVPAGVTSIQVDVIGAAGGTSQSGALGGCGGEVVCSLAVTPGQILNVLVGNMGGSGFITGGPGGSTGPGVSGGAGGTSLSFFGGGGGGGGGASDIRIGGVALANRVVAAGGGGGGGDDCSFGTETGGAGGGPATAGNGLDCGIYSSVSCGAGATPLIGGAGSTGGGTSGISLVGGDGFATSTTVITSFGFSSYTYTDGGGGGGGYFGGGGGSAGGGGGGSSYTDPILATSVVSTEGSGCADGSITISYCTAPVAGTIVGPSSICTGYTGTFTNPTSAGTLAWSSSDPTILTIGAASGIGTGVSPGVVTVTCNATTACGSVSTTTSVTVNLTPVAIVAPANVCLGSTASFTDGTPGGSWSSVSPGIGTIDAVTGLFGGVGIGTTIVSYTLGTCAATASINVVATPVAGTIVGPASICTGATATYTDPTATGVLSWTSSNPGILTIGSATGLAAGISPGVVLITCTATTPCGSVSTTTSVTVNLTPAPIAAPVNVCLGNSVTLTDVTPGGTWTSLSPALGTIDPVTGLYGAVAVGVVTIQYTLGSCSVTANINNITGVTAIVGPNILCVGSTISLTDPTAGGLWSSSVPGYATISGGGLVSGVSAGVTTISYTLGSCSATQSVTVTPAPTAIIGPFNVCVGSTITLTDVVAGGTWTSLTPTKATIDPVLGIVTGVAAGTSVIHYTIGGCMVAATVTVTSPAGSVSGPVAVCESATPVYTDAPAGGTWSTSNPATGTISAIGVLTPLNSGPLTVYYTLGACQSQLNINIYDTALQITGTNTLCQGDTTYLVDGTTGGAWSTSAPGIASVTPDPPIFGMVIATGFGPVTISYTMPNCPARTHALTVNPLPASIAGPTAICIGLGTVLTDATGGGVWTSSNPLVTVSPTGVVTSSFVGLTSTITYTLPLTGCYTTADVNVGIPPTGIHGDSAVCQGASATLFDPTPDGVWSSTSLAIAQVIDSTGFVTGISAGGVQISYTLPNGCFAVDSFRVLPPLPASVSVTGPVNPVCSGYLDSFIAHPVNGGTPTYFWKKFSTFPLAALGTGDTLKYYPLHGDVDMCYMVTSHICSVKDTVVDTFAINVYPDSVSPIVTITTEHSDSIYYIGEIVTFNALVTWGGTLPVYQWYVNGVLQAGATGTSFALAVYSNDTVYCVVTGNPPCPAMPILAGYSNLIPIRAGYEGVNTIKGNGGLSLFPNPNTGNFTLSGKVDCNSCKEVDYEVVNVLGQVVYRGVASPVNGAINEQVSAGNLASGSYMLKVNTETGNQTFHFVISK